MRTKVEIRREIEGVKQQIQDRRALEHILPGDTIQYIAELRQLDDRVIELIRELVEAPE